jgi:hypothetical protein
VERLNLILNPHLKPLFCPGDWKSRLHNQSPPTRTNQGKGGNKTGFGITLKQRISYLQRKTIGYCKKIIHAAQMLWINLVDYNYCQFHKSLRIDINGKKEKFKKRY